tara:strand:- start:447 stop:683 length:237 start_codon:yes stop_codon:yes gene_type:complete
MTIMPKMSDNEIKSLPLIITREDALAALAIDLRNLSIEVEKELTQGYYDSYKIDALMKIYKLALDGAKLLSLKEDTMH